MAGFTNRKAKYLDASTGLYPYVRLIEAAGGVYPEAERFLAGVKSDLQRQHAKRDHWRSSQLAQAGAIRHGPGRGIELCALRVSALNLIRGVPFTPFPTI